MYGRRGCERGSEIQSGKEREGRVQQLLDKRREKEDEKSFLNRASDLWTDGP